MLTRKRTLVALISLLMMLAVAPMALAQSGESDDDTSVSGKIGEDGLELSFEHNEGDDSEGAAAPATSGGNWYDNPVMIGVIAVGALVILVLTVMAVRGNSQRSTA